MTYVNIWAQAERNNRAVRRARMFRPIIRGLQWAAIIAAGWFFGAWAIYAVATANCAGCGL